MHRVEIMRPGRFRAMSGADVTFGEDQLRLCAVTYDPAKSPAPVVIGHPETNAPAYGWVKGLDFAEGTLGAYLGDLDTAFAEAVRDRRYAKVSASFFSPDAPANPRPGVHYLRHVGFLGATAPAVPGLKPVSFADGDALDFAHEAAAFGVRDAGDSAAGRALARVAELEAEQRAARGRDLAAFCDGLVSEARLPSGLRDLAFAALSQAGEDTVIAFGEGAAAERLSPREALSRLLRSLPPMVTFGEAARGDGPGGEAAEPFTMPAGYGADPEREAFARKAEAVAQAQGLSFAEAVRRLSRGARA